MSGAATLSFGLAFAAGLLSFLSPCVLPVVPSYVTFVTGRSLGELTARGSSAARRHAALHAALFVLGFSTVFVALGATASAFGGAMSRALPWLQEVGGVIIALLGLSLLGILRIPALLRERRMHLATKPAGVLGSLLVGVAFGAGWTPCVGPVLASILLYAGTAESATRGMALLGMYALGLGLPFWLAAVTFNWYVVGARRVTRWLRPIELVSGVLLIVIGAMLVTGRFALLSGYLAGFGQLITLDR